MSPSKIGPKVEITRKTVTQKRTVFSRPDIEMLLLEWAILNGFSHRCSINIHPDTFAAEISEEVPS